MLDPNQNLQANAVAQQGMAPLANTGIQTPAPQAMAPLTGQQELINNGINPVNGSNLNPGFLQKGGGLELGLSAVQTLGSLWNSFQQQNMAKKTFALQEESYRTNMANQKSTYNSALEDRIRARASYTGASEAEQNATIAERSL